MCDRECRDPSNFFSKTANKYDDWYKTKAGAFIDKVETELVFDLLPPQDGWKVLDVGCGTGNFSFKLADRGCKVIGIDASPHMLEKALKKSQDTDAPVSFSQMDLRHLEFADNSFDAIYSVATFEFVIDRHTAIDELWRVLKPGGKMIIGTIAGDSPWGGAYRQAADNDPDSVFRNADFATLEQLQEYKSDFVSKSGECLYIPPNADPDQFNEQEERKREDSVRGGFFSVLWEKPSYRKELSCQMSVYPLAGSSKDADSTVKDAIKILDNMNLDIEINAMSSIFTVSPLQLGNILRNINDKLKSDKVSFTAVLTISNTCGLGNEDSYA